MPESSVGLDLLIPDWPAPANVRGLVTTRRGGVSCSPWTSFNLAQHVGDMPQAVAANRAILRSYLPSEPAWLEQVHGVTCIDAADLRNATQADASFTVQANVVCAVLTADCLPVLVCAADGRVVGVAHAGWRGLAAGVIEALVAPMRQQTAAPMMAWLGPAIGPAVFQVGPEVRQVFVDHDPAAVADFIADDTDRFRADLFGLARRRLRAAGIDQVFGGGLCTASSLERFYSYRRETTTGRFASCVWLT